MREHRRKSLIVAAALVLSVAAYVLWPAPPSGSESVSPDAPPQAAGNGADEPQAAGPEPQLLEDAPDEPGDLARRAVELGETRQSELRELASSQPFFPHDVPMEDYKAALWSEIQANPPQPERPGDPTLDGETAYRQYMFYGMCSMAARTGNQVDRRLERIAERAESARGSYLRRLESRVDNMIDMYELCQSIPPEVDRRLEAVLWMTEAVRLGHEIAQVQFYEKAMGFLLRPDPWLDGPPLVMQHPELIGQFKATASSALDSALQKGHPEAWLAMSRAVFEGVVFPKDPVLALAYARVAEREAMANHVILHRLDDQKYAISQFLDAEQLAKAEELAHRLQAGERG